MAGAQVEGCALRSGKNAVSIVASSSNGRPHQIERLALVLPHASNLNFLHRSGRLQKSRSRLEFQVRLSQGEMVNQRMVSDRLMIPGASYTTVVRE